MSIIRVEKTKGYSVIKNTILNDTRLSYRAIGIAAHLLSKPDNWQIHYEYLWKNGIEGRDAILKAMKELEDCGYLVRIRTQDERGRWSTSLTLRENPGNEPAFSPTPGNPTVGKPVAITYTGELNTEHTNHSGQNGVGTPPEYAFSGMSVEPFSQNSSNENGLAENAVELFSPTRNEHKPGEKKPSENVPHTIPLDVFGKSIEYQTFSPNFRNEVERLRWNNFVEDHFASLTDIEKNEYLCYVKKDIPFFVKAREHVRIVSWVLYAWGELRYRKQCHNKHFWWKGCADIYNLCEGDYNLLIYLVDSALDGGKEDGFTLDNPASFYACMEKDMALVKELKEQGIFEEMLQLVLAKK